MKYLKTYNQILNESIDEKSIKESIDLCLQQLLDSYKSEYNYSSGFKNGYLIYEFYIDRDDDKNDALNSLKNSIYDIKQELGYDVKLALKRYNTRGYDKYTDWDFISSYNNLCHNIEYIQDMDNYILADLVYGCILNIELLIEVKNVNESLSILDDMKKLNPTVEDEDIKYYDAAKLDDLILTYKKRIDECILYLTDLYNVEYFDPSDDMGNQGEIQDSFQYTFSITIDDNIDECIDAIKSSIEKIKYDLNGDCEFIIDFVRGNISGILEDVEFKLREEYEMRTKRVKAMLKGKLLPNKDVATINLIIM